MTKSVHSIRRAPETPRVYGVWREAEADFEENPIEIHSDTNAPDSLYEKPSFSYQVWTLRSSGTACAQAGDQLVVRGPYTESKVRPWYQTMGASQMEMTKTPVYSIRKAPETLRVSGVGREAEADSERNSNAIRKAPETPGVSGVGREAAADFERNSNEMTKTPVHSFRKAPETPRVSGVGREVEPDFERIVGIDHCTASRLHQKCLASLVLGEK
ncbi:hypothetical protein EDD22DRAFT_848363 [Suillus occidentalis]|nr:hypothetical protein EDD22DRAFT_848363 [Suillus occidentalis]